MRRTRFRNRRDAGRALAQRLQELRRVSPVVMALPRGGVPVGYEVARALDAPLDIGLVRKLGAPFHPEFGVGAIAEGGEAVLDIAAVRKLGITEEQLQRVVEDEKAELERRRTRYRADHPEIDIRDRTVIVVDDGLATGLTAIAVARALRARGAARVILAVPICPSEVRRELEREFDGFVCLSSPEPFLGVGGGYVDFAPTPDDEVVGLLARSREGEAAPRRGEPGDAEERDALESRVLEVEIPAGDGVSLPGTLAVPEAPLGLIIFAHGSGSSRTSRRNRAVAERLTGHGFATLLFDLLTEDEAAVRQNVFDIGLLARRLVDATRWASEFDEVAELPIGYFGASTGAAAALEAAAAIGNLVDAVVSRGGRPDLASWALPQVAAPTLLIVGGADTEVVALNREAAERLPHCRLAVVPGAGHLFEESGALARVARLAAEWFARFLADGTRSAGHAPVEGIAR